MILSHVSILSVKIMYDLYFVVCLLFQYGIEKLTPRVSKCSEGLIKIESKMKELDDGKCEHGECVSSLILKQLIFFHSFLFWYQFLTIVCHCRIKNFKLE